MIHLYAAPTTNGIRVKVTLDECDLKYELHKVDMKLGDHKSPEFLALNPMGMTPVIVDENGPRGQNVTIAQSIGIMFYLAEKIDNFIPKDSVNRQMFWDRMMNAATDIGPTYGAISFIGRAKQPHKKTREGFLGRLKENYRVWDKWLTSQTFCVGEEITICDFALFGVYARTLVLLPDTVQGLPNLKRWYNLMNLRSGVQKGQIFDQKI
ncbi:MAG: glutathione S-transferase family protein [Pseudomonadota bacterium]|nr:glutathione S-transferase family protein [Pseudomonadota bacterium]